MARPLKTIALEPIKQPERFTKEDFLSQEDITQALDLALKQVRLNMDYFKEDFPTPATKDNQYAIMDNTEWTNAFWTGCLWLAYEYSGDDAIKALAQANDLSFLDRVTRDIELDHHDLGFLYTPSCMAEWKLLKTPESREAALKAADKLVQRYQDKGGFIQAWGELGKKEDYRYRDMAINHFYASANHVIRDDASAYHTFYFDPETGDPVKGVTRQGYSDDSAWARGQAWGIYGIPLTYRFLKEPELIQLFKGMTHYFLNRLPKDQVSYWDLIFGDGSEQSRDSSATAIAVCGIHEMLKTLPDHDPDKKTYEAAMHSMLRALIKDYANKDLKPGAPLLLHGVYSWHSGKGVDEGNIWGDYYYLEALLRFYKDWNPYW
ncbi:TPA: glycoside hydrolase family 88 protein [Streptococcus pyogenes]